jgi:galactofuranosylgalactofuranosylrhamnosyl-N-acetylglucosaminyl-diphospho-decaprenol beta-1,5/1,6-galactofuranosyltransferase
MSTSIADGKTEAKADAQYRVAQRVILPPEGDLDVLSVYIDHKKADVESSAHPDDVLSRHSVRVRPGRRMSFGSYFNAFPASYWRRWTVVDSVRLSVTTSGSCSLLVYRSNAKGAPQRVEALRVTGDLTQTVVDLSLQTFGDGGWYWFDVIAGTEPAVVDSAEWLVPDSGRPHGRTSLAVTTFNRPDYCLNTIRAVASDPDLRGILDELIIVDQGNQKVSDEDGFDEVAAQMGSQLRIIEQPNLGGSGGFSRGMYEVVTTGRSDYVLLLDDDINLETASIERLTTFADLCRVPTMVGGHMFDLYNRSVLHTFGEVVEPWIWGPRNSGVGTYFRHDFARTGLRESKVLHQCVDVDYNGWWMTLIPTKVVRQLGLAIPVFIKWDDSEYGLRGKAAGIPTVTLPGAAVWHVAWGDKDDLVGWQSYFHERNRLISALMHSPLPHGGDLLRNSAMLDLKHLVSMQYYTVNGRLAAQRDVLAGPDKLHEMLPTRLGEIRADAQNYNDGRIAKDVDAFPAVSRLKPKKPGKATPPSGWELLPKAGLSVLRQLLPVDPSATKHPQARIAHKDAAWWRIAQQDSAVVSTADGTGASWYQRDNGHARAMVKASAAQHALLYRRWEELAKTYRDALPHITSFEAWEQTFGISKDG